MDRRFTLMALIAIIVLAGVGIAGARHMMDSGEHMMGEYGYYGPGYGMAAPCGPGGQMGSWMMGPGHMMGGGMMGYGMGPGMMGPDMMSGMLGSLDLDDNQQRQLSSLREDTYNRMRDLMKQMRAGQFELRELYLADEPDAAAIGQQMKKLTDLRQKMLEISLDARKKTESVLTREQAGQLKQWRRHWMMGG